MNRIAITLLLLSHAVCANAEWQADPANEKQVASANAIEQIKVVQFFFEQQWH